MHYWRGAVILFTFWRFGLLEIVLPLFKRPWLTVLGRVLHLGRGYRHTRGERLRLAFESLGPIFVKFGQVLSTRRDLLPADVAQELALLQDRVPPFAPEVARARIEASLGMRIEEVFAEFEVQPVASASIAQVHFATLLDGRHGGREVAVKVLRPNMLPVIDKDLGLMAFLFVSVTSGVGGGVLRDLLSQQVPTILTQDIYAVAALIGSLVYYLLQDSPLHLAAPYLGLSIIIVTRLWCHANDIHLYVPKLQKKPAE